MSKTEIEYRKTVYEQALALYEARSDSVTSFVNTVGQLHSGVCIILRRLHMNNTALIMDSEDILEDIVELFTEFSSQKPKKRGALGYWWEFHPDKEESWTKRIEALKKAIKLCEQKLTE